MEVRTMHQKLALVCTTVASLLVCTAAARADFSSSQGASDPAPIPFTVHAHVISDRTGPDATFFHADPPGTGYVQILQPPAEQHFSGTGSITIPMIAFSTAPANRPDQFTPIPGKPVFFQVQLFITDDSTPAAG